MDRDSIFLSGETGAGKSIIIGSVNLALGGKVSKSMLRENAEFALVELIFSVEHKVQEAALRELEVYPEDGEIIMSRKIYASGRSVCRINSETVSQALMRKVASLLIDIHGQHEHESLLAKRNHMKYLDAYAKRELEAPKAELTKEYEHYTEIRKKLEEASLDAEQQAREISFLQYEIEEIENADLRIGEDEELEEDYRRMSHDERSWNRRQNVRNFVPKAAIMRQIRSDVLYVHCMQFLSLTNLLRLFQNSWKKLKVCSVILTGIWQDMCRNWIFPRKHFRAWKNV